MRDPNFVIAAAMLTAVLASIAPAAAQTEPGSSSDCLNISVDTERAQQLNAAISVCTRVLGRNDLSPTTRTELLVHRGVAYRNVGDLDKSLADLGAAQDLTPDDPHVSRMLAWTYRENGAPGSGGEGVRACAEARAASAGVLVALFRPVRHEEARGRACRLRERTRRRPE
jgi:hypothetical protein